MTKIIQTVPSLSCGDAVGNTVLALDKILKNAKYKTKIYANTIDKKIPFGLAKHIPSLPTMKKDDILIYHMATGCDFAEKIKGCKCRKIFFYHNITPPRFFASNHEWADVGNVYHGLQQKKFLSKTPDYCIANSTFSKQDLVASGYTCPIDIMPPLIALEDYTKTPSPQIIKRYITKGTSKMTNILFTGRLAPNKKQEDIIAAFYMYQKYYNPKSRLFIVGNDESNYAESLRLYVKKLGLDNVIFTGKVKFDEMLAYYKIADLFLCQSEHEGFCVPLIEAMFFSVPIIAYDCTAIGETLSQGGILLKEKNALETAGMMNYVLTHDEIKEKILLGQKEVLAHFENSKIEQQFINYMKNFETMMRHK